VYVNGLDQINFPSNYLIFKVREQPMDKRKKSVSRTDIMFIILTPVQYIFIIYNSTNHCTVLTLLLHIITYDLLLHVSTLIRHLQGALRARHEGHEVVGRIINK
jgi:hypothetical protein